MHADTDTGADVTARALATIEGARNALAVFPPENPLETITLHGMQIAAAAVRLTMRATPNGEPWYLATDGRDGWCWACEATGGHRAMPFDHANDCPALALDAAIRAAGEAGHV